MTGGVMLPPAAPPDATELLDPARARAWKSAQAFEAMTLGQMLAPMFETVKSGDGPFGGGQGEETWRGMLTQEMAKKISHAGGLGIAIPVYRQMLKMQEQANMHARKGSTP